MKAYVLMLSAVAVVCMGCGTKEAKDKSTSAAIVPDTVVAIAPYTTFTDHRDGKVYKKITIDKQTWMAENLNYATKGSVCYENKEENCAKYGRLYTWNDAISACPAGWHLPLDDEWATLENFVGGKDIACKKLRATNGWSFIGVRGVCDTYRDTGEDGFGVICARNVTDEYGFSALPGGSSSGGNFSSAGSRGYWWSATERDVYYAWNRYMFCGNEYVGRNYVNKTGLFSVRCVQDN